MEAGLGWIPPSVPGDGGVKGPPVGPSRSSRRLDRGVTIGQPSQHVEGDPGGRERSQVRYHAASIRCHLVHAYGDGAESADVRRAPCDACDPPAVTLGYHLLGGEQGAQAGTSRRSPSPLVVRLVAEDHGVFGMPGRYASRRYGRRRPRQPAAAPGLRRPGTRQPRPDRRPGATCSRVRRRRDVDAEAVDDDPCFISLGPALQDLGRLPRAGRRRWRGSCPSRSSHVAPTPCRTCGTRRRHPRRSALSGEFDPGGPAHRHADWVPFPVGRVLCDRSHLEGAEDPAASRASSIVQAPARKASSSWPKSTGVHSGGDRGCHRGSRGRAGWPPPQRDSGGEVAPVTSASCPDAWWHPSC